MYSTLRENKMDVEIIGLKHKTEMQSILESMQNINTILEETANNKNKTNFNIASETVNDHNFTNIALMSTFQMTNFVMPYMDMVNGCMDSNGYMDSRVP